MVKNTQRKAGRFLPRANAVSAMCRTSPASPSYEPTLRALHGRGVLDSRKTRRGLSWGGRPAGAQDDAGRSIRSTGLRHLWYQIDIADSDPATFVNYMRMAAVHSWGRRRPAAHFNPEPQQDIARFAGPTSASFSP